MHEWTTWCSVLFIYSSTVHGLLCRECCCPSGAGYHHTKNLIKIGPHIHTYRPTQCSRSLSSKVNIVDKTNNYSNFNFVFSFRIIIHFGFIHIYDVKEEDFTFFSILSILLFQEIFLFHPAFRFLIYTYLFTWYYNIVKKFPSHFLSSNNSMYHHPCIVLFKFMAYS